MLCNLNIINLWLPQLDFLCNIINLFVFILYLKKINILALNTWFFNNKFYTITQLNTFYFKLNYYSYNLYSFLCCLVLFILIYNRLFIFHTIVSSNNLICINFTSNVNLLFMAFLTAMIFLAYAQYNTLKSMHIETNLLVLFSIIGLDILVISSNIVLFYISLELQNFCLICLCSIQLSNAYSIEAALKMFLLGSFSSSLIILTCAGLFFETGSLLWYNIFDYTILFFNESASNLSIWFFLLNVGLLWKLGAAPMHMWLIDIVLNTRMFVSIFITVVPKIAIFSLFINKLNHFINLYNHYLWNLIIILCLVLGPLYAMKQVELKSILAFSSVGQLGFILIGLYISKFYTLCLYLFFYLLSLLFVWFCISLQKNFLYITNYKNSNNNISHFMLLLVVAISIAGLPPLPTFFAKIFIIQTAISTNLFLVVFFSIISTILSVFYSVRILQYIIQPSGRFLLINSVQDNLLCWIVCVLGSFLLSLFWYMQPINGLFIFNFI
jgi:NADH-quinone oxidoreductase subunit N